MKFLSKSLTDTSRFAGALLKKVNKGPNLVILSGPIGAGKTELVRAMAERLGIKEKIQSPTFGIRKEYAGMVHYDLYMANKINSNEFVSMLNEDLEENLVIVEWGAKISKRKLSEYFEVKVKILADDSREYELVE